MSVKTLSFPFGKGLSQGDDDRLLAPGTPRAVENLIVLKNGRLGMRFDYDALPMTVNNAGGVQAGTFFDLHNIGDRLFGIGFATISALSPAVPGSFYEFKNQPAYGWIQSTYDFNNRDLPVLSYQRTLGNVSSVGNSITRLDCAAGSGLVCMVWENPLGFSTIHVIDAASDTTLMFENILGLTFPRVVCTGSIFFVSGVGAAGTTPKLFKFNPATDLALVALTDPAVAGAAIVAFDMSLSDDRTTFWIAYGRTGPTTQIHGFNSAGANTHNIAGPAVLVFAITVFTEATNGGTVRIHLACRINATNAVNMSTYLGATSVLEHNTPAMFTGCLSQIALSMLEFGVSTVLVSFQVATGTHNAAFTDNTHAIPLSIADINGATLDTKLLTVSRRPMSGVRVVEGSDGSSTHVMYQTQGSFDPVPVASMNRLIAKACDVNELPNIAFDSSTSRLYRMQAITLNGNVAQPNLVEYSILSTDRRQSAQLGQALYLAGPIVTVFDSRTISEANFVHRPVFTFTTTGAGGALTNPGFYQFVAVYEAFDGQGRRIQSPPSDVVTVALLAGQNAIGFSVAGPLTKRSQTLFVGNPNRSDLGASIVIYRTQNAAAGNLTFYRDLTIPMAGFLIGQVRIGTSLQSDAALAVNEVLYTQGARGSLSGPLPFTSPEGCNTLAASADRILSGGLAAGSTVQESRALFPGEQVNWSDAIGFKRELRGQVLAVARLDERRLIFTAFEIFEMDGDGLDDNGNGDIGAPRRLPSDVGLFGGVLGWRSLVECSLGILFQGLSNQIYLLTRGGTTPQPIGVAVQDFLAAFPTITSAIYISADRTVRFTCNNVGGTDSIFLLYDVLHDAWTVEGPFGVPTAASAKFQGRLVVLQNNVAKQRRASHPPAGLIPNAWRSGTLHSFGLGQWGRVLNAQFYGEYQGDCALRCIFTFDDFFLSETVTTEVNQLQLANITDASNSASQVLSQQVVRLAGDPFSFKFTPNQTKCECIRIDFEVDVPFPNVIDVVRQVGFGAFSLPSFRAIGDRSVIILTTTSPTGTPSLAGWTVLASNLDPAGERVTVLERILNGSEPTSQTITFNNGAGANLLVVYTIRNSHPTAPSELVYAQTAAAPLNVGTLTPSWGLQNTLWLAALNVDHAISSSGALTISGPAPGFRRGTSVANGPASGVFELFCMDQALRAASLAVGPWNWLTTGLNPGGAGYTIAVRPSLTVPSAGLIYHYFTVDVDGADGSARKSPLQMG